LPLNEYHCSLREVAREMGISATRVQQIENEALEKVRAAFEAKGLGPTYLDEEPEGPGLFDVKRVL
jgi:DNA-directed RNA polymerase sigma subunit (sigma70/sigma32)